MTVGKQLVLTTVKDQAPFALDSTPPPTTAFTGLPPPP